VLKIQYNIYLIVTTVALLSSKCKQSVCLYITDFTASSMQALVVLGSVVSSPLKLESIFSSAEGCTLYSRNHFKNDIKY
jgi:hypothetical protein